MNETELLELKQDIDTAKDKAAGLKGQRELLTKQLNEKWKVKNPKEGKAKLESMQADIDAKDLEIQEATEKLEKQLDEQNTGTEE